MISDANFFFDLLSDTWDHFEDRDQFAALWEGYLQLGSDLILQMFQGDLSKSILSIPEFRRYRWIHYDLVRTVVPESYTSPYVFAFDSGDSNTLSIPVLSDQVRSPEDSEYLLVATSKNGNVSAEGVLEDVVTPSFGSVRVGDFVRLVSGVNLAEEDTEFRFRVEQVYTSTTLQLSGTDLTPASNVTYVIERSPLLTLVEGNDYVVSNGKLMFRSTPSLTQDGTDTAFQVVENYTYEANLVRNDTRLQANGGRAFTVGTDGVVSSGSGRFVSSSATFISDGVSVGDYLVVKPSGAQPTQVLTSQVVSKIIQLVDENTLEVENRFTLTAVSLVYAVLEPAVEELELVSTEDGTDDFPVAFAAVSDSPTAPSGISGKLVDGLLLDGDILIDTAGTFTDDLVGKTLRVFSGTGLDPAELAPFTIKSVQNAGTELVLDRKVTNHSPSFDNVYSVGTVLAIDTLTPVLDPGSVIYSDQFEFQAGSSNTELVTDVTLSFSQEVTQPQAYIKKLRDRRAASTVNEETPVLRLWAEESILDQDQLFQNFGFPVQVQQTNSQEYKNVLQGLWFAYWNGPSIGNIAKGLNLVFNLPYAPANGFITDISLPDPAYIEGTVESLFNSPVNTFDLSATSPGGDSRFMAFSVDGNAPTLITFVDPIPGPPELDQLPNTEARDQINAAVGSPIASLVTNGRMRLSALTSVKIDTVMGNPGLGFVPGDEDFGTYHVKIRYDDGTEETLIFGTQFPLDVVVGQRVEKFQPLTQAVGVFDYVSLPEWWNVFGIRELNISIPTFSQEDKDIVNDILKDFTFAVRVVDDAFTRLGPVDREIIGFFLEQIKPTISDYLFIIATRLFDVISVSDDRNLLSMGPSPDYTIQHSGETPSSRFDITWKNKRNISWNFANLNGLAPASGYGASQYDDLGLDTEDIIVTAPMRATLISGFFGTSYRRAEVTTTLAANFYVSSGVVLAMRRIGLIPFLIQPFEWPAPSMAVMDLIEFINSKWPYFIDGRRERLAWRMPSGHIKFAMHYYSSFYTPRLEVLLAVPSFGLGVSNNYGVKTLTGPIEIVDMS